MRMATVAPLQELIGDDADQIGLLYWRIVPRAATVRGSVDPLDARNPEPRFEQLDARLIAAQDELELAGRRRKPVRIQRSPRRS